MKAIYRFDVRMKREHLAEATEEYSRIVRSSRDVNNLARGLNLHTQPFESMLAVFLNCRNRVLGYEEVARGGVSSCAVSPADVFRAALVVPTVLAIVVIHNHPSGSSAPSDEDVALTARLREAGKLIGISVMDHLIVSEEGYFSFLDAGI
jgi:DNA repair protein RadC